MTYRTNRWDAAERRPARRHAKPMWQYHARLVMEAMLLLLAIFVVIVAMSIQPTPPPT